MSFFNVRHMGTVLYWARRYDESLQYLRRAQEMESDLIGFATYWSSQDYEMKGMHDQAVLAELQNAPSFDPMHWHDRLEKAYREGGPQAYWKASIRRSQASPHTACSGFEIASFHARIGDKEGTITDLRQALEERCFLVATLNADPLFDGFRSDPRFKDMLKQLNLGE